MSIKVLIIENDDDVRHLLDVRLRKRGYDIALTETGEDAIAIAQDFEPEVIIMETRLPDIDGLTLIRDMKALSQPPTLIVLSVDHAAANIRAAFEAGADDYLTKPFSPLVVLERIRINLIRLGKVTVATQADEGA